MLVEVLGLDHFGTGGGGGDGEVGHDSGDS